MAKMNFKKMIAVLAVSAVAAAMAITASAAECTEHVYGTGDNGTKLHRCINCNEKSNISSHKWVVEGETHTCSVCNKVVEGHTITGDGNGHKCSMRGCALNTTKEKHTYGQSGDMQHVCTVCGFKYNGGKTEHQWSTVPTANGGFKRYETITPVTCEQDGLYKYTCKVCNYVEYKTIKGGHAHKSIDQPTKNFLTGHWVGPHMIGNDFYSIIFNGTTMQKTLVDRENNRDKAILLAIQCTHCKEILPLNQEFSGEWGEFGLLGAPRKPGKVNGKWDYGYGSQLWTSTERWSFPADTYEGWDAVVGHEFYPQNYDVTLPWLPYDVTFVDYDGTVLKEEKVFLEAEYSSTSSSGGSGAVKPSVAKWKYNDATPPADPARDGYTFIGWDKPYTHVLSDLVITAQYAENCTVTYVDGVEDEEVFADQVIDTYIGANTPAFNGTPERYGYKFLGWTPAVADKVAGDTVYTAQWEKVLFTVIYRDGAGEIAFPDQVYEEVAKNSATPEFEGGINRIGYTFIGWEPAVAATVTADAVYIARWTPSVIETETETETESETEPETKPETKPETEPEVTEEIEDPVVPLDEAPVEDPIEDPIEDEPYEEFEDIEDVEVPLTDIPDDDVPQTGVTPIFAAIAILSGAALVYSRKKE